jgi:hypothetical protein
MGDKMRLRVLLEIRRKMHDAEKTANTYGYGSLERQLWMSQYWALRKFFGTVQYMWTKWKKQEERA